MTGIPNRKRVFALVTCLVPIMGASPSIAQENWDFTGFIYLWGAGLGGETVTGNDVDVSFSDILDNLDFGLMGTLEARKGP